MLSSLDAAGVPRCGRKHYAALVSRLRDLRARRVLMGGLGRAHLPQLTPDIDYDVIERDVAVIDATTLPNVTAHVGDFYDVRSWPQRRYDAIIDDIKGHTVMQRMPGSFHVTQHLVDGGVYIGVDSQCIVEARLATLDAIGGL